MTMHVRESHEPRLNLAALIAADAPEQPVIGWPAFDVRHGITDWGMDGNNDEGDCGFAMLDHANLVKTGDGSLRGTFFSPRFQTVVEAYWQYGIDQGEPGPNPDQGVTNAAMLAWAYKNEFIEGYAEVTKDIAWWAASKFGGVLVGACLNHGYSQDFNAVPQIPWGAPGQTLDSQAGHDILTVVGDASGNGIFVTWGGEQPFTAEFFANNVFDCWVIFDKSDPFPDWVALEAILTELHGTVTPIVPASDPIPGDNPVTNIPPVTPTPAPAPVVDPTPVVAPTGLVNEIHDFFNRLVSEGRTEEAAIAATIHLALVTAEHDVSDVVEKVLHIFHSNTTPPVTPAP